MLLSVELPQKTVDFCYDPGFVRKCAVVNRMGLTRGLVIPNGPLYLLSAYLPATLLYCRPYMFEVHLSKTN